MKKFLLINLILFLSSACVQAAYFNDDVSLTPSRTYNTNEFSRIGNNYHNFKTNTTYTVKGNKVYGSDATSYSINGNTVSNDFGGRTYQINNNVISPVGVNRIPNADGSF